MLNLHRDKKIVRREPGRDGKILCDHRQDGKDEVHRLLVRFFFFFLSHLLWHLICRGIPGFTQNHQKVGRRSSVPPVLSTCSLHINSGCGNERRILIGPW